MHAHHKEELLKLLSKIDDEDLFQLIWAANIVQSENSPRALRFLNRSSIRPDAIAAEIPSPNAIHKWELETLVNEGLTTPLAGVRNGKITRLRADHFSNAVLLSNRLRKLENKEFNIGGHRRNVLGEMMRIGHRQFPWQVGSANMANLYRNTFIYGQEKCGETFAAKYGVDVASFTKVAFGLCAHFMSNPVFTGFDGLRPIGVSEDLFRQAVKPLCIDLGQAKRRAIQDRKPVIHIAYKPSILRQYPCVNFEQQKGRMRAPLPQLIMDRMTTGLFYDVISGGGPIREEYGLRFEQYCLDFSRATLPDLDWQPEREYRVRKQPFKTSDLLCFENQQLVLAAECKATRMSREAMFGAEPSADRGFAELVKGVKQVWRFFAHCRLSNCNIPVNQNAVGMVLTLDNWLVMATQLKAEVLRIAEKEIDEAGNSPVIAADKRKVIFAPIAQLERVLASATKTSFLDLLQETENGNNNGWNLDSVHEELPSFDPTIYREYPFRDKINELLPWWGAWDG